jgi:predicted AlkP superfamily phosphohydrolase/phosphomutase
MKRVLTVAIDGATMDLIEPWADAGRLPALGRLISEGVSGRLESTLPPVTSPAWPSFATGKNPGKHGVFDFIANTQGKFGLVNASSIDGRTLWDLLSSYGARVGIMGVPVTYPPSPVNGYMITGLLSPKGVEISYPEGFLGRYERELGRYRVAPSIGYKRGSEEPFLADLRDMVRQRGRFALKLMENEPWDFMLVHFLATDIVQHALWRFSDSSHPDLDAAQAQRFGDGIWSIYALVDEIIGRMLDLLSDDVTVVVMSDHGFGPLHGVVNLNNLFLREGLLHLKEDPATRIRYGLFRLGLAPAGVYHWLERLGLQSITWKVSKSVRNRMVGRLLSFDHVDWPRTRVYSMGHVGQVYVNLEGREPSGIVRPGDEYEEVREEAIRVLHTLRHPVSGKPLVDAVIKREETYFGKHGADGPDLHVVMDGYRYISFPLFATDAEIITSQIRGDSGCHRLQGAFVARGPSLLSGQVVSGARILDLAPTILYLMGFPVPGDMDGSVLTGAFRSASLESNPVRYETEEEQSSQADYALSSSEEQQIRDRLRGLGYLG